MTEQSVATLHILNKRPGHDRFEACLKALGPADALLLIEDAVTALGDTSARLPAATFVLVDDCRARGLTGQLTDALEQVDYAGMVRLTDRFHRITSW